MNTSSNNPPIIATNSQAIHTAVTATGNVNQSVTTENSFRPYNTSKNCSNFLASIPPDDEKYIKAQPSTIPTCMGGTYKLQLQKRISKSLVATTKF